MAKMFSLKMTGLFAAFAAAFVFFAMPVSPAKAEDLDMKKIFRCQAKDKAGIAACDKSRELLLNNCTTCHVFVAIVVQQFDQEGWDSLFERHKGRAAQLNDAQLNQMKAYLVANFNPKLDPPDLPPELLKEWTAY
jgi:hypothetical protein